jgi:hypothetical protein
VSRRDEKVYCQWYENDSSKHQKPFPQLPLNLNALS